MGRIFLVVGVLIMAAPARGLEATLLIEDAKPPRRAPVSWHPCDGGECAELTLPQLEARFTLRDGTLAIELEWKQPQWIHRLAVELQLGAGEVRVIGRDLRSHTVKRAYLGRFDPKWVAVGAGTLVADEDVDEVTVQRGDTGTLVTIELDAAAARPFVHDARCARRWRDPNRHVAVPLRLREAGEKLSTRVQLVTHPVLPLVKSPWPDGRRAVISFTDHADQTTLRTLTALAQGFAEHHLVLTKALFAHGTDRPQLDDPRMVALADQMTASGSEIVPHSATPNPDDRAVTAAAMERFGRWAARTWIDHQPETNCEAFGDEGYQSGGRFGIADLLATHHYEYVWAEDDAPPGDLNLLSPAHPEQRAPTVWPLGRVSLGGPGSLWMFRTQWAFVEAKRFYAMYGTAALDKLEKERGLHLAHTYLDTYHRRGTRFGMRNVIVPADKKGVPGGPGAVTLDPRMNALLAELERRQARGTLWVATLAQLADRLRLMARVSETVRDDGTILLRTAEPVAGASFVVPETGVSVLVDGQAPKTLLQNGGETTFVIDLPAGETTVAVAAAREP